LFQEVPGSEPSILTQIASVMFFDVGKLCWFDLDMRSPKIIFLILPIKRGLHRPSKFDCPFVFQITSCRDNVCKELITRIIKCRKDFYSEIVKIKENDLIQFSIMSWQANCSFLIFLKIFIVLKSYRCVNKAISLPSLFAFILWLKSHVDLKWCWCCNICIEQIDLIGCRRWMSTSAT